MDPEKRNKQNGSKSTDHNPWIWPLNPVHPLRWLMAVKNATVDWSELVRVCYWNWIFFNLDTASEISEEKQPIEQEDNDAEPQHENEGAEANVEPSAVEHEPTTVNEKAEDENPSGSDVESEEESGEESDSDGYTTGSESSGSHTDHSASDKEVSCFK